MEFNFVAVLVASLVTLLVGFVWYNPKVFGTIWMNESGITEEKAKQGNMLKIFGLTIFYSLMLSSAVPSLVVHQMGAFAMVGGPAFADKALPSYAAFMADYGDAFRSFKHGALHGFTSGLFLALPITAINALFEQKSWKYILINAGYWIVSLTIMGAIICGWK
ncbi:hypothetical protein FEDK69T_15260 [Flavobacterium enshiense DK69]|uniref:DUF1761 domain-containing protein n=1 Tax=Flavobacterium enshiense DK69 TaxID=1107311 RepID=V6SA92_9FLAO|nr:DUF1761 domain-containing protein [Flavobacterium enshiense]ESU23364.1 hypothetical protein FEDK69T_15260 [Flavobacterium enshiense DK69]KGO96405.1 hypothetical protein Q767_05725 [Flavobacterium enshiense DK69]